MERKSKYYYNVKTLELMEREFNINKLFEDKSISIDHELKVPIGAGFGTSAACALGTALSIAKILELNITYNKATSMAHLAEIEMESGLGDVIAEVNGGITLRMKEGAPGIGLTDKMILKKDLYVICKSLGGIETSEIIWRFLSTKKDQQHRQKHVKHVIKKSSSRIFP